MSDKSKKIGLLVISVVLALGAGEIVLRMIGYGTITPEMNFGVNTQMALDQGRFLPDEDLFWKLPIHPRDVDIRAIQPDVDVPPKGERRRILVLGDSCSRLSRVLPPYSALLEDSLRTLQVEVWNAAVPGYTSWQGRAWLAKQLLAIELDVAVVYFGWNDHWRATGITDRDYSERLKGSTPRLPLLFQKISDPPPLRVSVDDYRHNLTGIVKDLEAIGTKVVLVAAPGHLSQEARARVLQTRYMVRGDDANALHREYLEVVHRVSEESNVPLVDAAAVFAALNASRQLLQRDCIHLTDKGHRLMTTLLTAQLTPDLAGAAGGPAPDTAALIERAHRFMQTDEVR